MFRFMMLVWSVLLSAAMLPAASVEYAAVLGGGATISALARDQQGNIYVTGYTSSPRLPTTPNAFQREYHAGSCIIKMNLFQPCPDAFVAKLDPSGTRLIYATYLGSAAEDEATAITVDQSGSVYVGGIANSGFPITSGSAGEGAYLRPFVAKLNPDGSALVYATFLDSGKYWSIVSAIALGEGGTLYVTGTTRSPSFPTTGGAFQRVLKGPSDVFVARVNALGTAVQTSTLLGGSGEERSAGIALDSAGNIWVAGSTESADFPATTGAFQSPGGGSDVFAAKLDRSGSTLLASSVFGGTGADEAAAVALDSSGAVYIATFSWSLAFPGVEPAAFSSITWPVVLTRLTASATLFRATAAPGGYYDRTYLAVAPGGVALVTGSTSDPSFPAARELEPCFFGGLPASNAGFLHRFDADGKLASSHLLGSKLGPVAVDEAGRVYVTGRVGATGLPSATGFRADTSGDGLVAKLDLNAPVRQLPCVVNAASYEPVSVAPGELVSLFGPRIGPATVSGAQIDASGRIAASIGATRVLFDGIPAPLLYVSENQINAVVPFGVRPGTWTTVAIEPAGSAGAVDLPVALSAPAVFTWAGSDDAAALNMDGVTINSSMAPAERGSVISIFATGAGEMSPPQADGEISSSPLARPVQDVRVMVPGTPAEIQYAGAAAGLVAGAIQVNLRIPETAQPGRLPLVLEIGPASGKSVGVWVK